MKITRGYLAMAIIIFIVAIDQMLKIWIKTHFYLGEDYEIASWFHIKFIENNGMAFGLELWNKMFLTLGRILAVGLFIWIIVRLRKVNTLRLGFFISMAMITAGAAGNIFDCVLYGEIFNNPMPPTPAEFVPFGEGYSTLFEGRVVDMFYFPIFSFVWPDWVPIVGGDNFEFFQYIFNIADSAICVGVFMLLLFYSKDVNLAVASFKKNNESAETDRK